jgi:opacity protein-like surface antigen
MTHLCLKFLAPQARRRYEARGLLAAAALLASTTAAAADFSVGVGAGLDRGKVDCVASFPCDHNNSFAKLYGSYQVIDAVDVQLVYFDAGRFKGGDTTPLGTQFGGTFKVSGFGLTGGYRWAFMPQWSLTARAGIASVRTRFEYASPFSGSVSETTTQPLAGLGVAYAITPTIRIGLDYDVTRLKVYKTRGSLQMLGVAAQFSF